MMGRRGRTLAAAMLGCVVLAGCANTTMQTEPVLFPDQIAAAIQEAEAGGAGDVQLAILRNAQSEGELSLEDARAATRAAVECVNDAGSAAIFEERTEFSGLVVPGYSSLSDTPEQDAIAEACRVQEDLWVSQVYRSQPSSLELTDGYRAQQAPILRSCLESHGYATDPDASPVDLMKQALELSHDSDSAAECLTEAKIE
jgi:hypothetical protein